MLNGSPLWRLPAGRRPRGLQQQLGRRGEKGRSASPSLTLCQVPLHRAGANENINLGVLNGNNWRADELDINE